MFVTDRDWTTSNQLLLCTQVHYHIIPAPRPGFDVSTSVSMSVALADTPEHHDRVTKPLTEKEMHAREFEVRNELYEDDAERLVESIRAHL